MFVGTRAAGIYSQSQDWHEEARQDSVALSAVVVAGISSMVVDRVVVRCSPPWLWVEIQLIS